ncbi:HlyD family secretion protein [Thioclava sp. BHET1]|nr:HlyD family secretion protein [Thioclava sp. BHET1]
MIIVRILLSAFIALMAVFGGLYVWNQVFQDPWTRDAHVRANIVETAPLVSGQLTEVLVANNELVKKGQVLFQIDKTDYLNAVEQAQATLDEAKAKLAVEKQQADRLLALKKINSASVADVNVQTEALTVASDQAAVQLAEAALKKANIDLDRTTVRSLADGRVTNLLAHVGNYAAAGTALVAVVDSDSFRIDAYFLETKIAQIAIGDHARIRLMSDGEVLPGKVTGISQAISYSQDSSTSLLEAPDASFQWIRQAQRIPVQISIDVPPKHVPLINGATASVIVKPSNAYSRLPWYERFFNSLR